jgi:epoxyqueuosine reductase
VELVQLLEHVATEQGAVGFGVADVAPFDEVRSDMEHRVKEGSHAGLTFTYNNVARSTDVRTSVPWAERLVVLASSYLPEAGSPGPARAGTARIARFATEDHYEGLRAMLGAVAALLTDRGFEAMTLSDDNRLVDRAAAVRAGVGWWGNNAMVLAPGYGPWLLLGSVVTDAPLPVSEPMRRDCGTCIACMPACPTGALVAPGVLDARKCLARWAQAPGVIPRSFRAAMGDRLYGCDDCLDACPPGGRLLAQATHPRGRVNLLELLGSTDAELLAAYDHFYLPGRRPAMLRRNALVVLGNAPTDGGLSVLAEYLDHSDPVLRLHAAWALGRWQTAAALALLEQAKATEPDGAVRAEIDHARR